MIVAVQQRDAIEFVLDLKQQATDVCAPLTVRAGLATGHALLFEGDDYIGSAVNMAARLCDFAKGVEVLIPTMQLERLPEGVEARPHGEVELRGFPGPIDVVELIGSPAPASMDTSDLWTRTPSL
jgi:class 3 adenylate cyclase